MKAKKNPNLFYVGTLISSVGSMTFTTALIIFMLRAGFNLFHVGLIIGLARLVSILITTLLGEATDRINPIVAIVGSELIAAMTSIGIYWSWSEGTGGFGALLVFCLIRTTLMALQTGSRAKLTKSFSAEDYDSNSRHASWLNKVTQGSTLFAGALAWLAYKYLTLEWVIVFDAMTFIVNGFIIYISQNGFDFGTTATEKQSILQKFKDLYSYSGRAARLDFLLATVMMGAATFNTRIVGGDQSWNPLLEIGYGLAVWVAASLEKTEFMKKSYLFNWMGLGLFHVLLGMFSGMGWVTFCLSLAKDTFFWLLFHRITTFIQMDTPQDRTGSVFTARVAQLVSIVAIGEILVGWWQKFLPVAYEGFWRAGLCFIVVAILYLKRPEEKLSYARPSL